MGKTTFRRQPLHMKLTPGLKCVAHRPNVHKKISCNVVEAKYWRWAVISMQPETSSPPGGQVTLSVLYPFSFLLQSGSQQDSTKEIRSSCVNL